MDRAKEVKLPPDLSVSAFRPYFGAVLVLSTLSVNAQPQTTIRTDVPLVLVPVTVTDHKGALIDGLHAGDFVLTDDGARQNIRMDTSDTVLAPVSLVIAIQTSDISTAALAKISKVGGMIQPLIAGERGSAAVIAFDDEIRVLRDFTSDGGQISAAFKKIRGRSSGDARMLDAIVQGTQMLADRPQNRRRILIVLGEARDRGSNTKLDQAVLQTSRANVIIYPATYSAYLSPWTAKPEDAPAAGGDPITALKDLFRHAKESPADLLARASGGQHFSFNTLRGLEQVLTRAGEEIHGQYLLSFAPPLSSDHGFHRLDVSVPSRPDAVIRARAGYWAAAQ